MAFGLDSPLKIAFVQDALPFQGGAEQVLTAALEVFPQAQIYTLVYNREAFRGSPISGQPVHTSFIDQLPGARRRHRAYFPLMPLAIERLGLSEFDLIVSFSYAVAHGLLPRPGQLHISYIHTPMRYAWQGYDQLLREKSAWPAPLRWALRLSLAGFRRWDYAAAARADLILAPSRWMASCIWRAYRRPAEVLYPPVDVDDFQPQPHRENFYITVSRLVAHKKVDLAVEAFNCLGLPLLVVGEGPELGCLRRRAAPNVTLTGWQPRERVAALLGRARGFIHAGEEDFGIAMVEAQAAGCPVIALDGGSAREIVQPGRTGLLFPQQSSASLEEAVRRFEGQYLSYDPLAIRQNALRFDRSVFLAGFSNRVTTAWSQFQESGPERPLPASRLFGVSTTERVNADDL